MQNPLLDNSFFPMPLLAQQETAPSGGFDMLLIMLLFMAGMYFLLIAPQRRKQKQHSKMVAALTVGDTVLTAGGLQAVVTKVKNDHFTVKLNEDTRVELDRNFIHSKVNKNTDEGKTSQDR